VRVREVHLLMEENGFSLHRSTGRHDIWRDAHGNQYPTSKGSVVKPRTAKNIEAAVKRMVKSRVNPGDPGNWLPIKKEEEVQALKHSPFEALRPPTRFVIRTKAEAVAHEPAKQETRNEEPKMEEKQKPSRAKYDAATRARVWGRIAELYNLGGSNEEIAHKMLEEGYRGPDGKPMSRGYVQRSVHQMVLEGRLRSKSLPPPPVTSPAAPVATATKSGSHKLPEFVLTILTDPDMTAEKKVRMLMAYAED
jgi:predicted RNA binding protein YcfA (HicA-like mRNA interferase family)